MGTLLLAQNTAAASTSGDILLRVFISLFILFNLAGVFTIIIGSLFAFHPKLGRPILSLIGFFRPILVYEILIGGAFIMMVPFYWMVVTSFKDAQTASSSVPIWTPSRIQTLTKDPVTGDEVAVVALRSATRTGQEVPVVPEQFYDFKTVQEQGYSVTKEVAEQDKIFDADPTLFETQMVLSVDLKNFRRAWYRPESTSRGEVNFLTYFIVSILTSILSTAGALTTSAFAAYAFARMTFIGKQWLFYLMLATMMVPGQVLLIPNFLTLAKLHMLDTYAALVVPWVASVFTIFLMRQFFMTIPNDLWDAARIDGASRFRYLWQVVVPLSRPVFITAGIFDFLMNWNSLLWPLIVTSSPHMRTLMVGLQNLNDDAGSEFHILMAASCFAVLPIIVLFFFLQRFFIEGIARTGLK